MSWCIFYFGNFNRDGASCGLRNRVLNRRGFFATIQRLQRSCRCHSLLLWSPNTSLALGAVSSSKIRGRDWLCSLIEKPSFALPAHPRGPTRARLRRSGDGSAPRRKRVLAERTSWGARLPAAPRCRHASECSTCGWDARRRRALGADPSPDPAPRLRREGDRGEACLGAVDGAAVAAATPA